MNYLGHAVFSPPIAEVLTGNMISDFVKGKKRFDYPDEIQKGIALHRSIDAFVDAHPAVKKAAEIFRPDYRLYAAAMIDVCFDYFIANDPQLFPLEDDLMQFSQKVYTELVPFTSQMPERFAGMFYYMRKQNWLYHYRFDDGMQNSFGGLVRRAAYLTDAATAFALFMQNKALLQAQYQLFMADFRPWFTSYVAALKA